MDYLIRNLEVSSDGTGTTTTTRLVGVPICPDLLSISDLGEADGLRGAVVRGFFAVLAAVSWLLEEGE